MNWLKKLFKNKPSREEIHSLKCNWIKQYYGNYEFGDKVEEQDGYNYSFVCIKDAYAMLFRHETKELRYITVDEEKLLEYLKQQPVTI